ncbi:DMT family transporter [Balneatrix alpica]|uniref:DMT family transporter n=1 Tax=Balneatrix alpica TaxID=75684 RepID=A0ABV5ZC17_9GAMM|nr:DMT family transporter [Balneatrix alpica]
MPLMDWALLMLANTAWAFNSVVGKWGVSHFDPLLFTALRFAAVLLLLFPWLRLAPGQLLPVLRIALVLGVIHFSLVFIGLDKAGGVGAVAVISQLYVPFTTLLAWWWLREPLSWQRGLGTLLAFLGVMLIGLDPEVLSYWQALIYVTLAALAMAVATIMMKQLQGVGVMTLQAWIGLVATPCLLLLSWLLEQDQWLKLSSASWQQWLLPLYSALGASLAGHAVVYYLLQRHPVNLVTPLLLLSPLLAVPMGVWLLEESFGWRFMLGAACTLLGVGLVHVRLEWIRRRLQF